MKTKNTMINTKICNKVVMSIKQNWSSLCMKNLEFKCSVIKRAQAYSYKIKLCQLCLEENFTIMHADKMTILMKRT